MKSIIKQFVFVTLISMSNYSFASSKSITINGAELEYEIKGAGSQILFFEAGAISGMSGWDSIWKNLPQNSTAIRYSRRGEGNSSKCSGNLTSKDYVIDTEELLKALKIDKPFVYISHSYGSKIARDFAYRNPSKVSAMLFVDPINPRDVEIIETIDPINGAEDNEKLKQTDIKMGQDNNWCLINDIWDKSTLLGFEEMGDIPMSLIAGVKRFKEPKRLFDTDKARELWGKYQAEWVLQFPRGKIIMANNSGHFVQDDEPKLVITELKKLLLRARQD